MLRRGELHLGGGFFFLFFSFSKKDFYINKGKS